MRTCRAEIFVGRPEDATFAGAGLLVAGAAGAAADAGGADEEAAGGAVVAVDDASGVSAAVALGGGALPHPASKETASAGMRTFDGFMSYFVISISSTSKFSVAFGGMAGGIPFGP
jgi:hypothetical protein